MGYYRPRLFGNSKRWENLIKEISGKFSDKPKSSLSEEHLAYLEELVRNDVRGQIISEQTLNRLRLQIKSYKEKTKLLINDIEKVSEERDLLLGFQDLKPVKPVKVSKNKTKQELAAFLQWSDWHVGETVSIGATNGLNEYNPEIAEKRVNTLLQNTVRAINDLPVDPVCVVLHLGGDFINGWIHEENRETNSMTPIEEILFATELLTKGIETLLQNFPNTKLKLVCNVGNHGRFTKKFRFGNEKHTSFETIIFSNLARYFKDRVEMTIPESTVFTVNILGQTCRFHHGHQVRYRDGVGGLTIPLNKKQAKWDMTQKADFNFMGHYHTCSMPNKKTLLNGSLVGYNGLAQFAGFAFEKPMQSMITYDTVTGWNNFKKILAV